MRYLFLIFLTGCVKERLSTITEPPVLTQIQNPNTLYAPVSMPMPSTSYNRKRSSNSLWEPGSHAFFKDQRAKRVGDILTVTINIDQKESIEMKPKLQRQTGNVVNVNNLLGLERTIENILPNRQRSKEQRAEDSGNPAWISANSNPTLSGQSKYEVNDKMKFDIAVCIVQVLPNKNLVVHGRQEIRLVNEVREIQLRGIVRPEDVQSDNRINSEKIAELRISYGGRGELTDMQDLPYGHKIINKISPF